MGNTSTESSKGQIVMSKYSFHDVGGGEKELYFSIKWS